MNVSVTDWLFRDELSRSRKFERPWGRLRAIVGRFGGLLWTRLQSFEEAHQEVKGVIQSNTVEQKLDRSTK